MAVLVALIVVTAGLAALTGAGERRRGGTLPVCVCAAIFFPVTWTSWYVRDVLLQPDVRRGACG